MKMDMKVMCLGDNKYNFNFLLFAYNNNNNLDVVLQLMLSYPTYKLKFLDSNKFLKLNLNSIKINKHGYSDLQAILCEACKIYDKNTIVELMNIHSLFDFEASHFLKHDIKHPFQYEFDKFIKFADCYKQIINYDTYLYRELNSSSRTHKPSQSIDFTKKKQKYCLKIKVNVTILTTLNLCAIR